MLRRLTSIRYNSSSTVPLLKTPLYDIHVELGGTMVPFAGYAMPVLYKDQTHIESHNWTRSHTGIFDVSHMLQHTFEGEGSTDFLQKVCPTDFNALKYGQSHLSVLLNEEGGVVDDTIVTKHGDNSYYVVTNAGCREKDLKFLSSELKSFPNITHKTIEGTLLAIQGPTAAATLQKFTNENLSALYFGNATHISIPSFGTDKFHLARGGYTGEDGFEISIPDSKIGQEFFRALLGESEVKPIGLAARDSLRLEAGMCLYGHELNEQTTPIESSLNWLVSKSRRSPGAGFNGESTILSQLENPKSVKFKRVGVTSKGPSPRHGNKIFNDAKEEIGVICSGSPSPTAGGNVAEAFINKPYNKKGTEIFVEIRGKLRKAQVAPLPFVEPNYYKA